MKDLDTYEQNELLEAFILWEEGKRLDAVKKFRYLTDTPQMSIALRLLEIEYNKYIKS